MTEEDAKTKLCVHQPFEETHARSDGTIYLIYTNPKCVGSECMAWREVSDIKVIDAGESVPDGFTVAGGNESITLCTRSAGYCGLAGKP